MKKFVIIVTKKDEKWLDEIILEAFDVEDAKWRFKNIARRYDEKYNLVLRHYNNRRFGKKVIANL